jgi:hypothetical protein
VCHDAFTFAATFAPVSTLALVLVSAARAWAPARTLAISWCAVDEYLAASLGMAAAVCEAGTDLAEGLAGPPAPKKIHPSIHRLAASGVCEFLTDAGSVVPADKRIVTIRRVQVDARAEDATVDLLIHLYLDFKKHGNGTHPPICFLFKCVLPRCDPSMPWRPCCRFQGRSPTGYVYWSYCVSWL